MKSIILSAVFAIIALIPVSFVSGEELVLESSAFNAKGGARVTVNQEKPKITAVATLSKTHLSISLSDGKQKFGAPVIKIKSGENVYLRPRLQLLVPIEELKTVKSGEPLLLSDFSLGTKSFEMNLVHSGSEIPNVVITTK